MVIKGPKNSGRGLSLPPVFGQCPKENIHFSVRCSLKEQYFDNKIHSFHFIDTLYLKVKLAEATFPWMRHFKIRPVCIKLNNIGCLHVKI